MTDRTLRFGRPDGKPVVNVRLGLILGVESGKRKFLIAGKPVLKINYRSNGSGNQHACWLITADVEQWRRELASAVPHHRFAADVPIEIHLESDEVVVVAELPTGTRYDPPGVSVAADCRHLVLTAAAGAERLVPLPVDVAAVLSAEVSATATMVVRLRRADSVPGVFGCA